MISQKEVDEWLFEFLQKLKKKFKKRLIFVGHHGSWARGEARTESDIDTIVLLDHIDCRDLRIFKSIVSSMPDAGRRASGILLSSQELQALPRAELLQFFYGCKTLYGSIQGVVKKPAKNVLIDIIKNIASENLHHARHYLLYPHNLSKVVHNLKYPFKNCFYALQYWVLFKTGKYIAKKDELVKYLKDDDDKKVLIVARDWYKNEKDRKQRPHYYIKLLERWSKKILLKTEKI